MKVLSIIGGVVLTAALFVGLVFGLQALGLVNYKFFGPQFQAVDREIYEYTPSYVQGKEQTLSELRLEYQRAKTAGEKANIKAMIVNEAATVNLELLKDLSLRSFVRDLREN